MYIVRMTGTAMAHQPAIGGPSWAVKLPPSRAEWEVWRA
jgi:hypothetical protein